jgi:UDP-N-acetylglucosamine 3-dehydrogenase
MKQIRVGIVGTGAIAERAHIPILSRFEDVTIEAICDADSDRLKRRSQEWQIPGTFTDFRRMLDSADLDAVFVCVPTFLHYEIAHASLQAGINVFCEKPMGISPAQARELVELAGKKSLVLAVGYNKRLNSSYLAAKRMVKEGRLGHIIQAHAVLMTPGPYVDWIASTNWFFDKDGGGVLRDLVSHLVDLWHHVLAEEILEVDVRGTTSRKSMEIPDNITCVLSTANGLIGTLSAGWGAGASNESIHAHGSGGSFIASPLGFNRYHGKVNSLNGSPSAFKLLRKFLISRMVNVDPFKGIDETYYKQDKAFIDSIAGRGRPTASGSDALRVLEVVEAMRISLERQKPVSVKEVAEKL